MAAEVSITADITKTIVQTAAIVAGWWIVHRLSTTRDRDKARRELLVKAADSLGEEALKLLALARSYHTTTRDKPTEDEIKMTLQDMSGRVNLLADISKEVSELASCRSALLSFKKAITAHHFEDEHESNLPSNAPQLQTIAAEGLRVRQCFLKLKHKQFPAE